MQTGWVATLVWAKTASVAELYQKTNCLPKCRFTEYHVKRKGIQPLEMIEVHIGSHRSNFKSQVEVKSEVGVDWRRDWISSLYLSVQSGTVELQEEYLVYDFQVDNTFKLFVDIKKFDLNIPQ